MQSIFGRVPQKVLVIGFFVSIAGSVGLMRHYPVTAIAALVVSALCFYWSRPAEAGRQLTKEEWIFAGAIYLPTLAIFGYLYNQESGTRHFKKYLMAHSCVLAREDIVRINTGACDSRTGLCDEGEDEKEAVFTCGNGNEISFRQFVVGGYGRRAN